MSSIIIASILSFNLVAPPPPIIYPKVNMVYTNTSINTNCPGNIPECEIGDETEVGY